eukprot:g9069.t1
MFRCLEAQTACSHWKVGICSCKLPERMTGQFLVEHSSFFAERLALEVSQPDFSKPHYVESSNFLSWLPDSSATAQIVTEQNTGNLAPFSKAQNQLYIHLALAATLRSALEAPGDKAIFRLNVINPAWALQRCDSQNVWRLSMWASGYHSASMETEYDFKGFAAWQREDAARISAVC